MLVTLDIDPAVAFRELAGRTAIDVEEIRRAGLAGRFVVLDGLRDGSIRYGHAGDGRAEWHRWQSWSQIRTTGRGDCKDLAPAVAAEYLAAGKRARPVAFCVDPATALYHVVVEVVGPGGLPWYGDPSALGGMTGAGT